MSDRKQQLQAIADELRDLRRRLEDLNEPFESILGDAALDIATATDKIRLSAVRAGAADARTRMFGPGA